LDFAKEDRMADAFDEEDSVAERTTAAGQADAALREERK
jgi:hypothetical protein